MTLGHWETRVGIGDIDFADRFSTKSSRARDPTWRAQWAAVGICRAAPKRGPGERDKRLTCTNNMKAGMLLTPAWQQGCLGCTALPSWTHPASDQLKKVTGPWPGACSKGKMANKLEIVHFTHNRVLKAVGLLVGNGPLKVVGLFFSRGKIV